MEANSLWLELESLERELDRRSFLSLILLVASVRGIPELGNSDIDFLARVSRTLIPPEAIDQTGIDMRANIINLVSQAGSDHRKKIDSLVSWAKRLSIFYGKERVAIRARGSRFLCCSENEQGAFFALSGGLLGR